MGGDDTRFLAGGGALGALVRDHAWQQTPLGPPEHWPPALRTSVAQCLRSSFPMLLLWGEELTMLYNDAYAPMLGAKHPEALGRPISAVWADIWDVIGPMLDEVRATGVASFSADQVLVMVRRGFEEETYFTWSFGPLLDDSGTVGGILDVVWETTAEVLARRRLALLARVRSDELEWREVARDVMGVLLGNADDVPFSLLRHGAEVIAAHGAPPAGVDAEALAARTRPGGPLVTTEGSGPEQAGPVGAVAVALEPEVGGAPLVLVLGLSPRLAYDASYREFCALLADAVGKAINRVLLASQQRERVEAEQVRLREHAERLEQLLAREHHIAETLQRSLLPPSIATSGTVRVTARYEPAEDAPFVGGDWYDATTLPDGILVLTVGDVVGHGLDAAAAMGHLRSATRALARQAPGPGELLAQLNALVLDDEGTLATCLVAYLDPRAGTVRVASAGHPAGMVRDADGTTRVLAVEPGLPLGVDPGAVYATREHPVGPGARVLMITDGVIERRRETVQEGLDRLRARFAEAEGSPEAIVEALLAASRPDGGWGDDAAMLLAELGEP